MRSGDRATSSGARGRHGASRAPGGSRCGATPLYSTSDVVTTRSELHTGQDQEHGREGQAEAHADRLSKLVRLGFRPLCRDRHVARCTPVRGARRALLDRGLKGGSQVWFLVPSKRSTRPPTTSLRPSPRCRGDTRRRRHRSFAAGAGHRAWTRTPASSGTPRAPTRSLRRWRPRAAIMHPTRPTCTPHEPPSHR